jgi:hypothetical protein
MNPQSNFDFHWLSLLGISVLQFLYGGFHVLIGVNDPAYALLARILLHPYAQASIPLLRLDYPRSS